MSISAISGNVPAVVTQPTPAMDPATAKQVDQSTSKATSTPPKHDDVKLSGAAMAKSLKHTGQTAAQIAVAMGVPVATIDSYLGIQTPVTVAAPAPKVAASATSQAATTAPPVKVATKA